MKSAAVVGGIACLLVIAGATLKIFHISGYNYLLPVGVALFFFYLALRVIRPRKR